MLFPGRLETAYRRELHRFSTNNSLQRLWAKDISLWPSNRRDHQDLSSNLAWLDLPQYIGRYMAQVADSVSETQLQGFQDVVFVAMGDSNLAMQALSGASAELRQSDRIRRLYLGEDAG